MLHGSSNIVRSHVSLMKYTTESSNGCIMFQSSFSSIILYSSVYMMKAPVGFWVMEA